MRLSRLVVASRRGVCAISLEAHLGTFDTQDRLARVLRFSVRLLPEARPTELAVLFGRDFCSRLRGRDFGLEGGNEEELLVKLAECRLGDMLDEGGVEAIPNGDSKSSIEALGNWTEQALGRMQARRDREPVVQDVLRRYMASKIYWSDRFGLGHGSFRDVDCLRFACEMEDYHRVGQHGIEAGTWTWSERSSLGLLGYEPTMMLAQSGLDRMAESTTLGNENPESESMDESLQRRKEERFAFLHELYRRTQGDTRRPEDVGPVAEPIGLSADQAKLAVNYLEGEGLIQVKDSMGKLIYLTHRGLIEVEQARERPSEATAHFPPFVFNIVGTAIGSQIQQAGHGGAQTQTLDQQKIGEISAFLEMLDLSLHELEADGVSPEDLAEMRAQAATGRAQLQSRDPDQQVLWPVLNKIKILLQSAAAAGMAADKIPDLLEKFPF